MSYCSFKAENHFFHRIKIVGFYFAIVTPSAVVTIVKKMFIQPLCCSFNSVFLGLRVALGKEFSRLNYFIKVLCCIMWISLQCGFFCSCHTSFSSFGWRSSLRPRSRHSKGPTGIGSPGLLINRRCSYASCYLAVAFIDGLVAPSLAAVVPPAGQAEVFGSTHFTSLNS